MIKTWSKSRIRGTYLNIVNAVYRKSKDNVRLNREKFNTLPLKLGMR